MQISEKAYAKLNISLDVSKPRDDGFHDMIMIMQSVSLCDDITISLNPGGASGKISVSSNVRYIPNDERNLAFKAAGIYLKAIGRENEGLHIAMKKRIPVGAGMAGGSSDAAAVLRALNSHYKALSPGELLELSGKVGSDVPFCVLCGTALAEGRGEILTPLKELPECYFAICKPSFSISTPELFNALDKIKLRAHPDTPGIIDAINSQSLPQICRRMYNVFEDVPDRRLRVVSEIKRKLTDGGAVSAIMTGTGSAVFGLFDNEDAAKDVCPGLEKEYGFCVSAVPVGKQLDI